MGSNNVPTASAVREYVRKNATPEWQNDIDYSINTIVFRSGNIYKAIQVSGPSTSVIDPATDDDGLYWEATGGGAGSSITEYAIHSDYTITDFQNSGVLKIGMAIANLEGKAVPASKDDETKVNVVGLLSGEKAGNLLVQKIALLEEISGGILDYNSVADIKELHVSSPTLLSETLPSILTIDCIVRPTFAYNVVTYKKIFQYYLDDENRLELHYTGLYNFNLCYWNGAGSPGILYSQNFDDGTSRININQRIRITATLNLSEATAITSSLRVEAIDDNDIYIHTNMNHYPGALTATIPNLYLGQNHIGAELWEGDIEYFKVFENQFLTYDEIDALDPIDGSVFLGDNGNLIQDTELIATEEYRVHVGYIINSSSVDIQLSEPVLISPNAMYWDSVPLGGLIFNSSSAVKEGYLPADGRAISRTDYSELSLLYAADGYPFGVGDGSTTFNIPLYEDPAVIVKVRNVESRTITEDAAIDSRLADLELSVTKYTLSADDEITISSDNYKTVIKANAGCSVITLVSDGADIENEICIYNESGGELQITDGTKSYYLNDHQKDRYYLNSSGTIKLLKMAGEATALVGWNGSTEEMYYSYNISEVDKTATGDYTIYFRTPMENTNYLVSGIGLHAVAPVISDKTINSFRIRTVGIGGTSGLFTVTVNELHIFGGIE